VDLQIFFPTPGGNPPQILLLHLLVIDQRFRYAITLSRRGVLGRWIDEEWSNDMFGADEAAGITC